MENITQERKSKSYYKATKENEFNRLTKEKDFFVPSTVEIIDEEIKWEFNLKDLKELSLIKEERIVDRYKTLINIGKLYKHSSEFLIDITPENLYYDLNFNVKLKHRDIVTLEEIMEEERFLNQYKSMIGYLLQNKYSYHDYYQGGLDLLNKNKDTKEVVQFTEVDQVIEWLFEKYKKENKDVIENRVYISKKTYKREKNTLNLSIIFLIILAIYSAFLTFSHIPYKESLLQGNNSFIKQDYEGVIKYMGHLKLKKIPKQSKYILAYSYVKSETLSAEQKKNIESTINLQSEEELLDFWIQLGTGKFKDAIDTSKKLGDDELLLYALIKNKQNILNDSSLKGEEKEKNISEMQSEIDRVTKSLEESSKEK